MRRIAAMLAIASLLASPVIAQQGNRRAEGRPQRLMEASPESAGMSSARLAAIDAAVLRSIERQETPGAVVVVGRRGRIVYRKAFGDRALLPRREKMTLDTIFDLASLTKVIATATSIMILVERGQVSLADPVALYIPEFGRFGKERVTVEQLLTHRAGFVPDNEIADYVGVTINPLEKIYELRPAYEPGARFVYSDVGYIVAAELVRRVTGKRIDVFAHENIFKPLGMNDTSYLPLSSEGQPSTPAPRSLTPDRIAPTENREGRWMRGEVHDPRAYELGGVAGHAGLFSTADDVAIYCQMILNGGEYAGVRVLAPYTIERMISAHSLPTSQMRGIGWDVNTSFSSNRGDLFPVGTFGHTGYTGTSIWIDPASETFVVLMTSRVHPSDKGNVTRLRSFVASIVAGAITDIPPSSVFDTLTAPARQVEAPRAAISRGVPTGPLYPVLTGIDVLERDNFKQLEGRRIGLITNHTGRNREGRSTIDVLASAKNLKLVA
ncbi:MAG TPA: serine hydrolase, partial [Blastocatellia bacterium]|nr:serine hydrolase [Blastocatellia bacterium]